VLNIPLGQCGDGTRSWAVYRASIMKATMTSAMKYMQHYILLYTIDVSYAIITIEV